PRRPPSLPPMSVIASFEWSFIWDNRDVFLHGLWVTLKVSLISIAGAFVVGLVLGAARAHRIPVVSQLAAVYVELIRNTPLLVQVFFVYLALVWALSGLIRGVERWLALPEAKRVRRRRQFRLREAV